MGACASKKQSTFIVKNCVNMFVFAKRKKMLNKDKIMLTMKQLCYYNIKEF